jgi:hypothetical protein
LTGTASASDQSMRRALGSVLLLVALAVACAREARERIIVLGLDGMDPETVDLLMAEGKLPSFARLREDGAYGRLRSQQPILSPIIWTTIATGKPPEAHGIGHFVAVNEQTGEQLPVTSRMRRVKALWNVFSGAGRTVGIVGWWATWPAETVNGAIVSDHTCYHFLFPDGARGSRLDVGIVHPPELAATLEPLVRRPGDLTAADVARFARIDADELARPFQLDDELSHLRWAIATAETYRRIGLRLWTDAQPDLLMCTSRRPIRRRISSDISSARARWGRARGAAGALRRDRRGRSTATRTRSSSEYLAAMDAGTTLVVLSDHGFALGTLPDDPSTMRDMRRVSERYHRLDGILYLYGAKVRRARLDRPGLLDVAPTLLALAGIPPAGDMPGRVLTEGITLADPPRSVPSYEDGTAVATTGAADDETVDPAILERLRALGYLTRRRPRPIARLPRGTSSAGRYRRRRRPIAGSSTPILPTAGCMRASPVRSARSVATTRRSPRRTGDPAGCPRGEGYHNRALVLERQGRRDDAIRDYRAAVQCNAGHTRRGRRSSG